MKKCFSIILCVFVLISSPIFYNRSITNAESGKTEVKIELEDNINDQLNNLDTSQIDGLIENISNGGIFDSNFKDKIKEAISGNLNADVGSFFSHILTIFVEDIISYLPSISLIIAIAVLYSMLTGIAGSVKNKGISDVIHFVCYGAIVIIVISCVSSIIKLSNNTLGGLKSQMDAIFPLLLTLLTAVGGTTSVSAYQPAMAILSSSIVSIFINILMPIFIFKFIFTTISNLTSEVKFNKFSEFFGSCYKWIIGIVLTVFSAFISIHGIMAGSIDGVSIRTAKYTIKGSIPIVGGFLSDGLGLIMISSSLIKNAIGVSGLLLMFCTIVMPIIKILVLSFLLKLTSAILEPIADSRITNFISDSSKSISQIIALILGVSFMYLIITGLTMCSANLF